MPKNSRTKFISTDCYRRFEWAVKRETRYVYNDEVQQLLAVVKEVSQKRKDSIENLRALLSGLRLGFNPKKKTVMR